MARIRFDFGSLTLDADLLDTPTARAVAAALPVSSSAMTWGEEVYFEVPVKIARGATPVPSSRRARLPIGPKAIASRSASADPDQPR